jgi:hypothetical protein
MRRRVISSALLANALASGVVLLVLLYRGGWGNAVDLLPVVAQILVVLAAAARSAGALGTNRSWPSARRCAVPTSRKPAFAMPRAEAALSR